MNNSLIELKNDFYDALVEVELQDVNDTGFEIKITSNNKYLYYNLWIETIDCLKFNTQPLVNQSTFELNETIRVLTKINETNLKGWVKGVIDQIKGEFYIVNLSTANANNHFPDNNRIFHKSELRKFDE